MESKLGWNVGDYHANRRREMSFPADEVIAARNDAAAAQHAAVAAADKMDAAAKWASLETQFGDWAVVADVLMGDGFRGNALAAELVLCQQQAPTAEQWMRDNF